jgi:hypothetical protein
VIAAIVAISHDAVFSRYNLDNDIAALEATFIFPPQYPIARPLR